MVVLSNTFLLGLSPGVATLLCDRELDIEAWMPLVEVNCSAPAQPGQRQNSHCLTLGTLLAAVNVFSFTATLDVSLHIELHTTVELLLMILLVATIMLYFPSIRNRVR